ncbi:MAG: tetratricopeptide repeat protein [Bacteroidota bacterium]
MNWDMIRYGSCFCFLLAFSLPAQAQENLDDEAYNESQNLTWEANKKLSENNFVTAEADYRRAISKSGENVVAPYNLGNAYYNTESYSEAFGRFKQAGELADNKADKHRAFHNMGNVFMKSKEYQKAVEAYKNALRNDPTDEETRYNLALAKELLKKEQDQNQQNQDNKDQQDQNQENKDQNEEQNKDQQQNKDQDQGDGQDQQEDEKDQGDNQKEENKKQPEQGENPQEQPPRPSQLSKQQIQNLLEAMQNEEKKVQEKIDAQKLKGVKVKTEKDW